MRWIFQAVMALVLLGASRSSNQPEIFRVRIPLEDRTYLRELAQRGFDIAGVDLEAGVFDVLTDSVGVSQLKGAVAVQPQPYQDLFETATGTWKRPSELESILRDYEKRFPNLVSVVSTGKSLEGKDIWAARVTDAFSYPDGGKATILFDAMHHAREIMTPEIAFDIIDYLATRASTDEKVQEWLTYNEVWVVPMLNPDGNSQIWKGNTGWRKNTRGGYGVDINRNYPFEWNACNGSSGQPSSEQYRGSSAGSEPETNALMAIAKAIQPVFNISYHSTSEIVIYPMSCPSSKPPAAQKALVENLGQTVASKLVRDSGSGKYTPGYSYTLLYPVDGGSNDWMYGVLNAFGYVIEVNSQNQGFQPSFARWRDSTVERNRPGWQWVLDRTNQMAIRARARAGTQVQVTLSNGTTYMKRTADRFGWAHFLVPRQGEYKVADAANPTAGKVVNVTAGRTLVDLR